MSERHDSVKTDQAKTDGNQRRALFIKTQNEAYVEPAWILTSVERARACRIVTRVLNNVE